MEDTAKSPGALTPGPTPFIVAAEKNLEEIGFFSATCRNGDQPDKKTVTWRRLRDGKEAVVEVTIVGARAGLPNTQDLDLYRAFQLLLWKQFISRGDEIRNPIAFTSSDLLLLARKDYGGKQGDAVYRWMQKMQLTGIASKGAVYNAKSGDWLTTPAPLRRRPRQPERDLLYTLTVFAKVAQEGQLVNGVRSSVNLVWLQDWYLTNLQKWFTKPVDLDLHFRLERPLAKVMLAVIDGLLFAGEGKASKRYADLCQVAGCGRFDHLSRLREQLDPAFAELQKHEYLARWSYKRSADETDWIVSWTGGRRWHDFRALAARRPPAALPFLSDAQHPRESGQLALCFDPPAAPLPTPASTPPEALQLVQLFHTLKGHKGARATARESEHAEALVAEYGLERAEFIVRYASEEMQRSKFPARWFGAVMNYAADGAAAYARRREATIAAEANSKAITELEKTIEAKVDEMMRTLSPDERIVLRAEAERELSRNPFQTQGMDREKLVHRMIRDYVAKRARSTERV